MDGPVVTAAKKALEIENVNIILPYVHREGEAEVRHAFEKSIQARHDGPPAREVADLYFFETVVRIHRAGEGAPYTGLKPAGLDEGPVIPLAEKALETGSAVEVMALLSEILQHEVESRLEHALRLRQQATESVEKAREYVEAMLGFQVYSHKLYQCMKASAHDGHHEHG
jgi:hypothetical protein